MAHSTSFKIRGYKDEVTVIHNGDWSGEATVVFQEEGRPEQRLKMPAKLLIGLSLPVAKHFVRDQMISHLEAIDVEK